MTQSTTHWAGGGGGEGRGGGGGGRGKGRGGEGRKTHEGERGEDGAPEVDVKVQKGVVD